jgi:Fic family protein
MLRSGREPASRGELMIANNYRTIRTITNLLDEPVTPALLLTLQASLTEGTLKNPGDVGRFRQTDDDIVVGDDFGRIVHVPPSADRLSHELERLCEYANHDGPGFVHPMIKACLLHFWLAYVHPFCDGNGRTARALFYLHVMKSGFWLMEYVAISRVILRQRARYERAFLYSETDDADCTYFLSFHLKAIELALEELWEYMERKSREDELLGVRLHSAEGLNYRQRALLTRALKDGGSQFTIESHRASHDVSYGTSRNDLLDLVKRGYLTQQRKGRRTYVFFPAPNIRERIRE